MGLDSVELVMIVERHFGILIPDKEAEKIRTVDDFAECVYAYVATNPYSKCKSQCLFYILRNYFSANYNLSYPDFKPSTNLAVLFPIEKRKEMWEKLENDFSLKIPELGNKNSTIGHTTCLDFFLPTKPRPSVETFCVRDLVNWILSLNHEKLINIDNLFSKEEIVRIIIGIINDKMAIDVIEIAPHHSIVEDLGIN
mgnify:CR=1 FL=1